MSKLLKGDARAKVLAQAAQTAEALGTGDKKRISQQATLETSVSSLARPIGYTTNDKGERVLNAPTLARVTEAREVVVVHYVMGSLGCSEDKARAILKLKHSKDKYGEKGYRSEDEHLAVRAGERAFNRAKASLNLKTGDKREGNSNAKRTGSNPPDNKAQFDTLPEAIAPKVKDSPIYDSTEAFNEHVMAVMSQLLQASKKAAQKKVLSNKASTIIEDAHNATRIAFG